MVEIKYVPTICPYCGTGCGLNFVVKDGKIVGVEPLKRHPVNEGRVKYVQKVTLDISLLIGKTD